jgi:AcrR family transcriptional regulator
MTNTPRRGRPRTFDAQQAKILKTAVDLANTRGGFPLLTRTAVAAACGISEGLVSYYYASSLLLKRAVMEEAVRLELLEVIAAGLVLGDVIAHTAPVEVKQAAVDVLMEV